MNDSKTEFIQFRSAKQLCKCVTQTLSVNNCEISKVNVIKYLGAYLGKNLTMKSQIQSKCRSAMANHRRIASIIKYLTIDACKQIVPGLIISHLDYCNSLVYGLPNCEIKKLQRIQNMAVKLVLSKNMLKLRTSKAFLGLAGSCHLGRGDNSLGLVPGESSLYPRHTANLLAIVPFRLSALVFGMIFQVIVNPHQHYRF
ncbi:hypothetical protein HOLleu_34216 [Holothuria leucospilota]|uniref:Uncharacterized protein n=1 Tax=Holothuria leucospilota TaxID=206669 RepID=A0A9Q1BH66_HOLLE|nr:hypothetical protein HOLleu_34216 [Holothuria leucospilota]